MHVRYTGYYMLRHLECLSYRACGFRMHASAAYPAMYEVVASRGCQRVYAQAIDACWGQKYHRHRSLDSPAESCRTAG